MDEQQEFVFIDMEVGLNMVDWIAASGAEADWHAESDRPAREAICAMRCICAILCVSMFLLVGLWT